MSCLNYELLEFIEAKRGSGETLAMSDMTGLYDKRIAGLGYQDIKSKTTRLREKIECLISDIKSVSINHC